MHFNAKVVVGLYCEERRFVTALRLTLYLINNDVLATFQKHHGGATLFHELVLVCEKKQSHGQVKWFGEEMQKYIIIREIF